MNHPMLVIAFLLFLVIKLGIVTILAIAVVVAIGFKLLQKN